MKYLRAWISFLLAGIILYTTSSFLAQEEDNEIELEKWYFATLWSGEFGPLVAFTVDGEVNILIEDGVEPRPTKPGQNRGKVSTITY